MRVEELFCTIIPNSRLIPQKDSDSIYSKQEARPSLKEHVKSSKLIITS